MKIGILGLIGAGKDTFANELLKYLDGYSVDRYATPLKELTCTIFDCTLADLEDRDFKEKEIEVPHDVMVDAVFHTLNYVVKFNIDEMEQAADLFFEHFGNCTKISPREFQQVFGTEVARAVRPNVWRDYLQDKPKNLVVPDVRFENELCEVNVLIIKHMDTPRPTHSSEHLAWDLQFCEVPTDFDESVYVIPNIGTVEELSARAKEVAERIKQETQGA